MATASSPSPIGINIQYDKQKVTMYVGPKEKVSTVIARARQQLGLDSSDDQRFLLLMEGQPLPDTATAEATIVPNPSTVFILRKATEKLFNEASKLQFVLKTDERYGFCKDCKGLCPLKALYKCGKCRKDDTFTLTQTVNFFDDESLFNAAGMCSACGHDKPQISYLCKSCERATIPFLRQIRDNIHDLPCMKCTKQGTPIFLFNCSSQHTMCFECFDNFCVSMLSRNKFKNFDNAGFSVCCPGPGEDCSITPISDPHHFRIINPGRKGSEHDAFYKKYIDESIKDWAPPGDNIRCGNCNVEVDVSQGQETEVVQPAAAATDETRVQGGAWFFWRRLFTRTPQPPPPPTPQRRKQVACFQCQKKYCCVCKKLWHEGDCVIVNEDAVEVFKVEEAKAQSSCWPRP